MLMWNHYTSTAVTIRPGTLVTLPVPSGSYCVLELPIATNTDLMDIVDQMAIITTDNNSVTFIITSYRCCPWYNNFFLLGKV